MKFLYVSFLLAILLPFSAMSLQVTNPSDAKSPVVIDATLKVSIVKYLNALEEMNYQDVSYSLSKLITGTKIITIHFTSDGVLKRGALSVAWDKKTHYMLKYVLLEDEKTTLFVGHEKTVMTKSPLWGGWSREEDTGDFKDIISIIPKTLGSNSN